MNTFSDYVDHKVHSLLDNHPIALGVIVLGLVWGFALYLLATL